MNIFYKKFKNPKQILSEIIAILCFILLSLTIKVADITECNAGELLLQIQTQQELLSQNTHESSKAQILQKVITNYSTLGEQAKATIDTIWNNEVGNLLFRSFYDRMHPNSFGLEIHWNEVDSECESNKICYDEHRTDADKIYVDEELLGDYIGYYKKGGKKWKLKKLPETLDAMLFHEILHGYHRLNSTNDHRLRNCGTASRLRIVSQTEQWVQGYCKIL